MNMSHDSTSLTKSTGDCLKVAKQRYNILSEVMLFRNYCIISGSAEALVRYGGKLQLSNITCMPNIMKIRQCFLKLQSKISGMFF